MPDNGEQALQQEISFTDLLLQEGVVDQEDLEHARQVQASHIQDRSLGEILVQLRYLTRSRLAELLRVYKTRIRLGELLVENGVLRRSQLEEALAEQSQGDGRRLGQILIEKNFITERNLLNAICQQKDIPFIEPARGMLDDAVMSRMSLGYLRQHSLIPLSLEEDHVRVIVHEFPVEEVARQVKNIYERDVRYAMAVKEDIDQLLAKYRPRKKLAAVQDGEISRQSRVVDLVDHIIREAIRLDASDIHIEPLSTRFRIRYRIDGVLVHRTDLPREMAPRLIARIKILASADIAEHRRHQDGRFQIEMDGQEIDMRVSFYITVHGENVVMRILNKKVGLLALDELGMPPRLLDNYDTFVLGAPAGVVVITGPTGSGKTTTLYSSIDACNEMGVKIITAEDPVEYQIDGIMQCSINPKIGLTFNDTLKSIVRQDPDIIVLGEIRDRISAETAIQAALTGHKVFTTFHTEDSVGGLLRLMNMEIETFLISSTVICVVAQRLVRRLCDACKEQTEPMRRQLLMMGVTPEYFRGYPLFKPHGCRRCNHTGYKGRTAIYEMLVLDEPVKDAILERRTSYHIRRLCIENSGLVTLQEGGLAKVVQGVTTVDEVLARTPASIKPRPLKTVLEMVGEEIGEPEAEEAAAVRPGIGALENA